MKTSIKSEEDRTVVETYHEDFHEVTVFRDTSIAAEMIGILQERLDMQLRTLIHHPPDKDTP